MQNKRINKIKLERVLAKSILEKIPSATNWIFSFLLEMGEATIDVFLHPSYYGPYPKADWGFIDFSELKRKPKFQEKTIRQSIRRLRKHGFVEKRNRKFILTAKGRALTKYVLGRKKIFDKKWDGKFRVVIFDIPEQKSRDRNWLRQELYVLQYKLLQKSVFIGKYPLPEDIIKSIRHKKIGNYVNYLLVDKVYRNAN